MRNQNIKLRNKDNLHQRVISWMDDRHIYIKPSFFYSDKFVRISPNARILYIQMIIEAKGGDIVKFGGDAMYEYGVNQRTGNRRIKELLDAGVIERVYGLDKKRIPATYRLIL